MPARLWRSTLSGNPNSNEVQRARSAVKFCHKASSRVRKAISFDTVWQACSVGQVARKALLHLLGPRGPQVQEKGSRWRLGGQQSNRLLNAGATECLLASSTELVGRRRRRKENPKDRCRSANPAPIERHSASLAGGCDKGEGEAKSECACATWGSGPGEQADLLQSGRRRKRKEPSPPRETTPAS